MQPANRDREIWIDGALVPWEKATVHLLSHSHQRGSLVFDYMSVHDTPRGQAIFRLDDHVKRFVASCELVGLPLEYPADEVRQAEHRPEIGCFVQDQPVRARESLATIDLPGDRRQCGAVQLVTCDVFELNFGLRQLCF